MLLLRCQVHLIGNMGLCERGSHLRDDIVLNYLQVKWTRSFLADLLWIITSTFILIGKFTSRWSLLDWFRQVLSVVSSSFINRFLRVEALVLDLHLQLVDVRFHLVDVLLFLWVLDVTQECFVVLLTLLDLIGGLMSSSPCSFLLIVVVNFACPEYMFFVSSSSHFYRFGKSHVDTVVHLFVEVNGHWLPPLT